MLKIRRWAALAVYLAGCGAPTGTRLVEDDPGSRAGDDQDETALSILGTTSINGSALPAKTVALTYDDGPDEHTLELARYLTDNGVRVTFFVNGRRLCKSANAAGECLVPPDTRPCNDGGSQEPVANPRYYPESILDELIRLGHHVANHTQDHCHLLQQTNAADFVFELKATQDILDRHICDGVYLFRAPFGEWNASTAALARAEPSLDKLRGPFNWDVDGKDWECWQMGMSVDECATRYMSILSGRMRMNGIVLMHDRPEFNVGSENPVLLTKWLVPRLKADGYQFATLDTLIGLPAPVTCLPDAGSAEAGSDGSSRDADANPRTDGGAGGSTVGSGGSGTAGGVGSGTAGASGGGSSGSGTGAGGALAGSAGRPNDDLGDRARPREAEAGCSCRSLPRASPHMDRAALALMLLAHLLVRSRRATRA